MVVLAEVLIVATNLLLDVSPFMMSLSAGTMFFMVFGIVSIGIGFGAMYPNFKYENIARISAGFGGVLYMIVSALFIALVIVLEAGPVYIIFMSEIRGREISVLQWVFITASLTGVLLVIWLAIFKPINMGLKALERNES
jgi:ABC-2 type transport system permease protein